MAKRGRKPQPTALKLVKGTRKDRVNTNEPKPPPGKPDPPDYLDEIGRKEWDDFATQLESMGVLTKVDGRALGLYCDAYSRWRRAVEAVETFGNMVRASMSGQTRRNPALDVAKEARGEMLRLLVEFGCTPSSRSRVEVSPKAGPADELDEFLMNDPREKFS